MEFIDLKAQYRLIEDKIRARIDGVLERGAYIMGPEVQELEERLAEYVGVNHCVTCANGTDALQLALMSLDIGPGDAVFTTPFTFFATAEAIAIVGATPVFVDIDPETYNLCPEKLDEALEKFGNREGLTPKAVIAVDLFGLPADYTRIAAIADKYGMKLIEDGAQGFGGQVGSKVACSFGDLATTSFFPAKPLGCYGDGGALFTNNATLAERLKSLRVHGKGGDKYDNVRIGMNSRLDSIQAAVLIEKLKIFPEEVKLRNLVASRYIQNLSSSYQVPIVPEGFVSSWAQFTLRAKSEEHRALIMAKLKENGIPTAIYYGKSLHQQAAFMTGCITYDLSESERASSRVFSLPMHPYLKEEEMMKIIDAVNLCVES